jgi:translocation and assembly module TamB
LVGGRKVAKKIGLDEISLGTSASGQQLLSLGKTISDRLSLGYKQGLTSTESALELTYLISQHWSVVTRGGRIMGLNIFYSKRFDTIRSDRAGAVPTPAK